MITLKSKREIEIMREASRVVGEILEELRPYCLPGITTRELDRLSEEKTRHRGAKPAFKGYRGYPHCAPR
jgi:methionyl aminopeptidase